MTMRWLIIPSWLLVLLVTSSWIATYFGSNTFHFFASRRVVALDSYAGEFSLWLGRADDADQPAFGWTYYPPRNSYRTAGVPEINPNGSELWFLGFCITDRRRFPCASDIAVQHVWGLAIPFWSVFAASLLLAIFITRRYSTRSIRRRTGCCEHCGYDLRASTDRCPECGKSIPCGVRPEAA